jgi:hypothetical protein
MDNHASHCTLAAYNFCKEKGMVVLTIPPHTSHRLQPLDVAFYSSLKSAYNVECGNYLRSHPHERLTTFEIAEIFQNAFGRVATPVKAIKGFENTGIFPVNPDHFTLEHERSFADIIPLPGCSQDNTSSKKCKTNNNKKQHSEIFTSTPMKII